MSQKVVDILSDCAIVQIIEQGAQMTNSQDQDSINSHHSGNPQAAAIDVQARNLRALDDHAAFFQSDVIESKTNQVLTIVRKFFPAYKNIYVNYRANRGKPFVVVKVDAPAFPSLSAKRKLETYTQPLEDLGVQPVFAKGTNSWLYRIYN